MHYQCERLRKRGVRFQVPLTEREAHRLEGILRIAKTEGSFGTGYLKPMQHVYRTKAAIVVNLRIVALREQTVCLLYGG